MSNTESGARRPKSRGADARRAWTERARAVVAIPIDSVADAAIAARIAAPQHRCDVCDQPVSADTLSRGLYIWSRGDERRYEEPPLCEGCATILGISALSRWRRQEEEDE